MYLGGRPFERGTGPFCLIIGRGRRTGPVKNKLGPCYHECVFSQADGVSVPLGNTFARDIVAVISNGGRNVIICNGERNVTMGNECWDYNRFEISSES